MMVSAHLAFYLHIAGVLLPLIFLGTAYALYGTAFWTGLARSILIVSSVTQTQDGGDGGYSRLGNTEQEGPSETEGPITRTDSGSEIATFNSATSLHDGEDDGHVDGEEDDVGLIAVGYGTATSVLNISTTLVPILLAGVENVAGYSGLEIVFILLAGCGCIASITLVRSYSRYDSKIERRE
ncbi:hypothetical protein Vi05172_g3742 [Venturia inaequalis]|nr:hypothetical protein Vi05172_g3742 [Venturia inaequalis]